MQDLLSHCVSELPSRLGSESPGAHPSQTTPYLTWTESGRGTDTAYLERDGACRGDGPLGIWQAPEKPARGGRLGASVGFQALESQKMP